MNTIAQQLAWSLAAGVLAGGGVYTVTNASTVLTKLKSLLQRIQTPDSLVSPPGPPEADVFDHVDLDSLRRLSARAARSGCPKLIAAVREVEINFFNVSHES